MSFITIIEEEKDEAYFNWDPKDVNERNALSSLTSGTIKEWQNDEEDNIWR